MIISTSVFRRLNNDEKTKTGENITFDYYFFLALFISDQTHVRFSLSLILYIYRIVLFIYHS